MTPDARLRSVLKKYNVSCWSLKSCQQARQDLYPYTCQWAGASLLNLQYSGLFAKKYDGLWRFRLRLIHSLNYFGSWIANTISTTTFTHWELILW